jgi:hypothetical protein
MLVDRHLYERYAARRQHASELVRGLDVVGDVLEHVAAEDEVELTVPVWEPLDVERAVHEWPGREIAGLVAQGRDRVQACSMPISSRR